tara:strand:+ start:470 stop:634 length:165 start_codon:yes stop_codon:yes gene_type:complete
MAKIKNELIDKATEMSQDPVFRTAVLFILDDVVDKAIENLDSKKRKKRKWMFMN